MTKLTEYTEVWPKLSDKAEEYMNNMDGSTRIPDDIRIELENFVKITQPMVEQATNRVKNRLCNILK
jgi:hypothetical protein